MVTATLTRGNFEHVSPKTQEGREISSSVFPKQGLRLYFVWEKIL
jgi:hypothetical protein